MKKTTLIFAFCLTILSHTASSKTFQEGVDFLVLPEQVEAGKGKVIEFFAYGCIFCFRAEFAVEKLKKVLPSSVTFEQRPLLPLKKDIKRTAHTTLFLLLKELDLFEYLHSYIYQAIHIPIPYEKKAYRKFVAMDYVKRFLIDAGVSEAQYQTALNKITEEKQIDKVIATTKLFGVKSTPSVVIDGKYLIKGYRPRSDSEREFVDKILYVIGRSGMQ